MSESVFPAIVVAAYNRPDELQQLCTSLNRADIPSQTPIVFSIDGEGEHQDAVIGVAQQFDWDKGPKEVRVHAHLGLVDHFHLCGDLTEEFGSVIVLEDDLIVAPSFHLWASAALGATSHDDRIAGVSLATPFFDGYRHLPFEPVLDGSDGVYLQVPWYDGMAWNRRMWADYRSAPSTPDTPLHAALTGLDEDEWFPDAMRYLIATDRFYLMPRNAHATNSGAAGAHFDEATNWFQVPLTMRSPSSFIIAALDDALAVYDDHMELDVGALKRLVPELSEMDLTVDLLAVRNQTSITTEMVVTSRNVRSSKQAWGADLHPLVANLVHNVPGDAIHLARTADLAGAENGAGAAEKTLLIHAMRGQSPAPKELARQLADVVRRKLRRDG